MPLEKLELEVCCMECFMLFLEKLRLEAVWNVSCCFLKNLDLKLCGMFHAA
jgi:hypothetical protein